MSARQLAGLALIGGALYALWRRGVITLPGTVQPPSAAIFPGLSWPSGVDLGDLTLDLPSFEIPTFNLWPGVAAGLGVAAQLQNYLQAAGISAATARGIVAGAYAESRLDPHAVNPTSGAYGIGQWLGSRKAELFRRYGSRPSLAQQMEFLAWELRGGDHGGAAVLAQTTPHGALDAYIRRFMRPAPGAETTGDLARGARYLARPNG